LYLSKKKQQKAGEITEHTPPSTVLPEKLTVAQLFKKFPAFYGNPSFTTVFITV
jgi:hypothetical protein